MPDTGWVVAGTGADDAGGGGTEAWLNPDRITADDASRASASAAAFLQTHYLKATNFGFLVVPSDATIDGVEVRAQAHSPDDGVSGATDGAVLLVFPDRFGWQDPSAAASWGIVTDALRVFGGASALWGEVILAAHVRHADWGWVLSAAWEATKPLSAAVDVMEMKIYYTLAPIPPTMEPDYADFPLEKMHSPMPMTPYIPSGETG